MENKKLKRKIAACLISNELGFVDKDWFSAGEKLSHGNMVDGLTNFMLRMVAGDSDSDSKATLKKGVLVFLKKRQE